MSTHEWNIAFSAGNATADLAGRHEPVVAGVSTKIYWGVYIITGFKCNSWKQCLCLYPRKNEICPEAAHCFHFPLVVHLRARWLALVPWNKGTSYAELFAANAMTKQGGDVREVTQRVKFPESAYPYAARFVAARIGLGIVFRVRQLIFRKRSDTGPVCRQSRARPGAGDR